MAWVKVTCLVLPWWTKLLGWTSKRRLGANVPHGHQGKPGGQDVSSFGKGSSSGETMITRLGLGKVVRGPTSSGVSTNQAEKKHRKIVSNVRKCLGPIRLHVTSLYFTDSIRRAAVPNGFVGNGIHDRRTNRFAVRCGERRVNVSEAGSRLTRKHSEY